MKGAKLTLTLLKWELPKFKHSNIEVSSYIAEVLCENNYYSYTSGLGYFATLGDTYTTCLGYLERYDHRYQKVQK